MGLEYSNPSQASASDYLGRVVVVLVLVVPVVVVDGGAVRWADEVRKVLGVKGLETKNSRG